jgi:hypothetical protein
VDEQRWFCRGDLDWGVIVLCPALIAFWGEFCRIVIRWEDVCYTENLAKECLG